MCLSISWQKMAVLQSTFFLVLLVAETYCHRNLLLKNSTSFKIAIFADLHFGEAENLTWGPEQDVNSTRVMKRVLAWEQPQLVVFSGDQITGENIGSNATSYWSRLVQPCVDTNTSWVTVFGNHDDLSRSNGTREELLNFDMSFPLSHSEKGPDNIHGLTNYYKLVWTDDFSKPKFVMYFLDSGGGSYPELVYEDQLQWVKKTAIAILSKYQWPVPGIAFFHIPSTGYENTYTADCAGSANDTVSPQIKPNNLLHTLWIQAFVGATFVGHNHGNDWCCPHKIGVHICFARHTGYGGYGTWDRGSRIITYDSTVGLSTYVRMESGEILWKQKIGSFMYN